MAGGIRESLIDGLAGALGCIRTLSLAAQDELGRNAIKRDDGPVECEGASRGIRFGLLAEDVQDEHQAAALNADGDVEVRPRVPVHADPRGHARVPDVVQHQVAAVVRPDAELAHVVQRGHVLASGRELDVLDDGVDGRGAVEQLLGAVEVERTDHALHVAGEQVQPVLVPAQRRDHVAGLGSVAEAVQHGAPLKGPHVDGGTGLVVVGGGQETVIRVIRQRDHVLQVVLGDDVLGGIPQQQRVLAIRDDVSRPSPFDQGAHCHAPEAFELVRGVGVYFRLLARLAYPVEVLVACR